MGRSAASFKRNFSDAEARVEGYLPLGPWAAWFGGFREVRLGWVKGLSFLLLKQKFLGSFLLPSNNFNL